MFQGKLIGIRIKGITGLSALNPPDNPVLNYTEQAGFWIRGGKFKAEDYYPV